MSDIDARRTMCATLQGEWVDTFIVGACIDGNATLTLDGTTPYTLHCTDGMGDTAEGECVYDAKDGVYYNDGPSSPA